MGKEILREIGKIYRALNSFSDILMKSIDLEKGQYQFLLRIKENPTITQQQLSKLLVVDKTTTAKAVKKLILKGYIAREQNVSDKRNYELTLTKKGKEICVFLDKEEQYSVRESLQGMNLNTHQELLNQLKLISKNTTQLYMNAKGIDRELIKILIEQEKL
ncbi:MarR family winged helix-turn-helix transcriptional regulator [Aquimarina sp. W85]|uniref:MarR family winged helix-turn-helix transcriptional regulator n=1 Tax=Aquimarina rhodophyticola TaxID=3342246 RepID=UPI00366DDA70